MRPPDHLSVESQDFWTGIVAEYDLAPQHLRLLQLALESWDEATAARKLVDAEGMVFVDRFGQSRPHPAVSMAMKAREAFRALMKQLDLEGTPYRR